MGELILAERESGGKAQPNPTEGALRVLTVGFRPAAVPVTTQTRLTFEVVLPLWGHRGPQPTPAVHVHPGHLSAKERERA